MRVLSGVLISIKIIQSHIECHGVTVGDPRDSLPSHLVIYAPILKHAGGGLGIFNAPP